MISRTETPWDGLPPCDGWHWLTRQRDQRAEKLRMAYYDSYSGCWRVADAIGRTVIIYPRRVAQLYRYHSHVPSPTEMAS